MYLNLLRPATSKTALIVKTASPVPDIVFHEFGRAAQNFKGSDGINVTFYREDEAQHNFAAMENILGANIGAAIVCRVWERGVGPTGACGTAAVATASQFLNDPFATRDNWVAVTMPGGTVFVSQRESGGTARLSGFAEPVFRGIVDV